MALTNKDIRKLSILGLILLLLILSFLIIRPIALAVLTGLILAYICLPLYKKVYRLFRERNTSALAVCLLLVLIIFIPLWFIIPLMIQQAFNMFTLLQTLDVTKFISQILPTSSDQVRRELISVVSNFVGNIASTTLNSLAKLLIDLPNVLLNLAVIIFVFFFTLRDHDKFKEFFSGLSPIKKEKEKILIEQFRDITSSIIFGYIIIGIIQGIATGLGLLVFGVPQALLLTFFAIFASMLPMIGPWLVWIPVVIYLLVVDRTGAAIGFAIYSALFVSSLDNILRPYIVSRKTGVSPVIVLVGMIGGLFVFGILGIILGPLILSYLIIFLKAYKDRTLSEMFHSE